MKKVHRTMAGWTLFTATAISSGALAQTPPPEAGEEQVFQLQEIVVTAQRRAENLQKEIGRASCRERV